MFKNIKLKKALIGAGLGVLGVGTIVGTTWSINHFISQKQNIDTGFDADDVNHDYGETVDLPKNIIFKRNVAGQAATLNVKATVLPDTVVNKKLTWTLQWTDGGSHGNISDYVTVTPGSDTLSATITLKAGFNNQIKLVVASQQSPSKSTSCTLDYAKRIIAVDENKIKCGFYDAGNGSTVYEEKFGGTHSLYTIFDDSDLDYIFADQGRACRSSQLIFYNEDAFTILGTTGTPTLTAQVQFVFDDTYKNAINSNKFYSSNYASSWASTDWRSYDSAGLDGEASFSNQMCAEFTIDAFETATTHFGSIKGLYGFAAGGSCTINLKFTAADGFEKVVSATFNDGRIPSLTDVTGIQLDKTTYVF